MNFIQIPIFIRGEHNYTFNMQPLDMRYEFIPESMPDLIVGIQIIPLMFFIALLPVFLEFTKKEPIT